MCIGSKLQGSRCGPRMPHRCTACTLARSFLRSPQRPLRVLGWLDGRVLWAPNPKKEKWVWTCDVAFSCCMCLSFSTWSVCVWNLLRRKYVCKNEICKSQAVADSALCLECLQGILNMFGRSLCVFCQLGILPGAWFCVVSFMWGDIRLISSGDHPECNVMFYLCSWGYEECCSYHLGLLSKLDHLSPSRIDCCCFGTRLNFVL